MTNVKPPLTPAQRQLRMNIRNAYGFCSVPELLESKRHRATIGRSEFELSCFDELISEAACERNRSTGNPEMKITSLPQESGLSPMFGAPVHLTRPEFVGNAVIHDGYNGRTANVSLFQCNAQGAHGVTKVIAVTEFGTSFVFRYRKMFDINAFVADEIRKQSNVVSVVFRSEWL